MSKPEFDAKVPDQIVTGKGETLVRGKGQTEFQKTHIVVHQYTARNSVLMTEDGTEVKSVKDLDKLMHDRLFGAGSPRQSRKTETLRQFMKRIDKKR